MSSGISRRRTRPGSSVFFSTRGIEEETLSSDPHRTYRVRRPRKDTKGDVSGVNGSRAGIIGSDTRAPGRKFYLLNGTVQTCIEENDGHTGGRLVLPDINYTYTHGVKRTPDKTR